MSSINQKSYVNLMSYLGLLHQVGKHDNAGGIGLPHHPPKVVGGVWQGPLSCYVFIHLLIPLHGNSFATNESLIQ